MKYKKRSEKQKAAQSTSGTAGDKGAQLTSGQKCGGDFVLEVPVEREKEEDDDIIVLDYLSSTYMFRAFVRVIYILDISVPCVGRGFIQFGSGQGKEATQQIL